MKVIRGDNQCAMRAEIYPFADSQLHITVERERETGAEPFGSKWEAGASVNWSALGSRDVETTRLYASAILEACRIADEMNAVPDHEHTTPGGYMVIYRHGETGREMGRRIESGADVPMYDGWLVGDGFARLRSAVGDLRRARDGEGGKR